MPDPVDSGAVKAEEMASSGNSSASTPQARRQSLLKELIDQSRRDFEAVTAAVSNGTVDRLEQIEEGVPFEHGAGESSGGMVPPPGVPPPRRLSGAVSSSSRQSIIQDISMRFKQAPVQNDRLVQVNMKNFSYYIPMKMDKPTVPTVFNQSVPYAAYEVIRRIHRYVQSKKKKEGNDADQPSSGTWTPTTIEDVVLPYSKRPVLKDVNLVLKPGRAYLVLGPPGSGKTTLLKAIADRLSYSGDTKEDSVLNLPHREGRIEYNGVSTTVRLLFG
jgi:ABC-type multidrug transport system fused ATPase/permease subunit